MRVGLVSCSKQKADVLPGSEVKASELYTSTLFNKSRRYVEACCDAWGILSARHGLLMPDDMISAYEQTLAQMSAVQRMAWAIKVADAIAERWGFDAEYVVLAGKRYSTAVAGFPHTDFPLRGLNMGARLRWLNRQTTTPERKLEVFNDQV